MIKDYGCVDYIYENIYSLNISEKLKQKLILGKENAYLSRYLGKIVTNVPINFDLNICKNTCVNKPKAKEILEKLEMFSVIKRIFLD